MSDSETNPAQAPQGNDARRPVEETGKGRGSGTMMTVYACAAIGGGIAAIADVVQKEQASAVVKITSVSARHLELAVPPLYVLGIVIVLSVLLCFVFQPVNRKAGFAVGAGVIASIMTVTPYQSPESGQPVEAEDQSFLLKGLPVEIASSDLSGLTLAAFASDVASVPVKNDLETPVEVRMSFYDRNSRRAYEQVRTIAPGRTGMFRFSVQSSDEVINGEYYLVVNGKRSRYISVSGKPPVQEPTQTLTDILPDLAANPGASPQSGGVFHQLQKTLTTPKKW